MVSWSLSDDRHAATNELQEVKRAAKVGFRVDLPGFSVVNSICFRGCFN